MSDSDFSPEVLEARVGEYYDELYFNWPDWAEARRLNELTTPRSQQPTIPFEPLAREIGYSPETDQSIDLTPELQQEVSNWIGRVKKPFDLIQRAEGRATPENVYYGSQQRSGKNLDPSERTPEKLGEIGRAAVHTNRRMTALHFKAAKERVETGAVVMLKVKEGEALNDEDVGVMIELLQELANGIAANMDDAFQGGDTRARTVANSILAFANELERGAVNPRDYRKILYASVGYTRKQLALWGKKLGAIRNFCETEGIDLHKSDTSTTKS